MVFKHPGLIVATLSYIFGGFTLFIFAVFLWAGNLNLIDFGWNGSAALIFNAGLSLAFFLQHSIMVRRSFKRRLSRLFPDAYHEAVYSIASGIFLFIVIIFWQATAPLWEAQGLTRLFMRLFFILPIVGFFWAVKSLGFFDPFGIQAVFECDRHIKHRRTKFVVKGPYRWVRHPLYFFILIMIWLCPDLSTDRLFFNFMWSVWIIIGAHLEERDLAREFGNVYRNYQKSVPMLFPYKLINTKIWK